MEKAGVKRLATVFTLLLIVSAVLFHASTLYAAQDTEKSKKNKNFKVETECGIDGFAVYDNPVVVKVTVESKSNFTGDLRLVPVVDNGQKVVAYSETISLAAGEAKTFTFIPSALSSLGKIKIELADHKDNVVYSESKKVNLVTAGTNITVGILSDDYSALNYFDGITADLDGYQGLVNTLELNKDSLPADSAALSILNYIILDNFDTAGLSDEQYTALKEWVNNGGVLILSLGSNYQNVLHIFKDEFITGTINGMNKKDVMLGGILSGTDKIPAEQDSITNHADFGNTNQEKGKGSDETDSLQQNTTDFCIKNVDCVSFAFDGASELADLSDNQTAYQKKIGVGNVIVLSYSLGMEPVTSYPDRKSLALLLLQEAATDEVISRLNGAVYNGNIMYSGTELAQCTDDTKNPSALLYGSILFLYVVLVGPVLYLVLKAWKKREKIWIAVPVVSLVFTGIIYMTGFFYRVSKPLINTFSIVNLQDGFKTEQIYTNITCPKAQKYTLKINDGYSGFWYNMNDYYYGALGTGTSNDRYDFAIKKTGDGTEILLNNDETFEETALYMKKTSENTIGAIDCDLKCTTTGFEGSITNNTNYDLKGVVVTFENHFYQAGDLKKGERVSIDPSKTIEAVAYGTFENLYSSHPNLYKDRELYMEYQINTTMEAGFINPQAFNQGHVWAQISSYQPDIIGDSDVKQTGYGVILQTYSAEYEDITGIYYPDLEQMEVTSQGEYDSSDGMLYDGAVTITYSFEGYPGITTLENLSYGKKEAKAPVDYGTTEYANVYAYNSETGNYDLLFENGSTLSGAELEKYISGNVIILKYEKGNGQENYYMPRIVARGDK